MTVHITSRPLQSQAPPYYHRANSASRLWNFTPQAVKQHNRETAPRVQIACSELDQKAQPVCCKMCMTALLEQRLHCQVQPECTITSGELRMYGRMFLSKSHTRRQMVCPQKCLVANWIWAEQCALLNRITKQVLRFLHTAKKRMTYFTTLFSNWKLYLLSHLIKSHNLRRELKIRVMSTSKT